MKNPALSVPYGLIFILLLGLSGLSAQDAQQLTDFRAEGYRRNHVEEMVSFQGRIYTANRPVNDLSKGRFSEIDPETGTYTPLKEREEYTGGRGNGSNYSTFQELDGKLFAQVQVAPMGLDLFRIEADSAFRLTNLIKYPVSELVHFEGQYYFLVLGRPFGVVERNRPYISYLELWKTDGTAAGTALVEELPMLLAENFLSGRATLAAGAESLLISGASPEDPQSLYKKYYLYRPGQGVARVTPEADPEAGLQHYGDDNPQVAYFAGGFYLSGRIESGGYTQPEVFRIEEATGTMRRLPGILDDPAHYSYGDNASYAVIGDSLYLYAGAQHTGYVLYAAGARDPDQFRQIAAQHQTSALHAPLTERNGALYFGGATEQANYTVLRYVPGGGSPEPLFSLVDAAARAKIYVGDDVVYTVANVRGSRALFRYRFSDDALDRFDNGAEGWPLLSTQLYGNDLVYLGKPEDGSLPYTEAEPYLLEREATAPRVLAPIDPAVPLGVTHVLTTVKDGRLLLIGYDSDLRGTYHLYDETAQTISSVTHRPPSMTYGLPFYVNTIDGEAIFASYSYDDSQHYLYTLQGDSLHAVIDRATGAHYGTQSPLALQSNNVVVEYEYGTLPAYRLVRYTFADTVLTRSVVASPTRNYNLTVYTAQYFRLIEETDNVNYGSLFHKDGRPAYDFTYASDATLLTADSVGYYLLYISPDNEPALEYHNVKMGNTVRFTFPEDVTFDASRYAHSVGNRFIFQPYSPSVGSELYAADPSTGRIELLADINPGPSGGGPVLAYSVDSLVYFTAKSSTYGLELYRTDGTPGGTYLVADIHPGPASSRPGSFYHADSVLYFSAAGKRGEEVYGLRLSDESVRLIADINPGAEGSLPRDFLGVDSSLYVVAFPAPGEAPQLFRVSQGVLSPVAERNAPEWHMSLFPNPATDRVTLLPEPGETLYRVRIYDSSGRLIRDEPAGGKKFTLPLQGLGTGRYVAVAHYASGRQRAAPLIIVR